MPRGRKKNAQPETLPEDREPAGAGHNGLTDRQEQALFFHHKRRYQNALAIFKKAQRDLQQVGKAAKAEGVLVDDIKTSIAMEAEGGEGVVMAEIQRKLRIMRWQGKLPGQQGDMFTDAVNAAAEAVDPFERGILAGMNGDSTADNPYAVETPDGQKWLEGVAEGQAAMVALQRKRDAEVFDEADGKKPADDDENPGPQDEAEGEAPPTTH